MIVIKETLTSKRVKPEDEFINFPMHFYNYIEIFNIDSSFNFQIKLKDEFFQSKEIEKEIRLYFEKDYSKYMDIEIVFVKYLLPF